MNSPSSFPIPSLPPGLPNAWALCGKAFAEGFAPDPQLTVSEWADEHRVLSNKSAAEPGQWRTSRVPYLREIMDCLSVSDATTDVVFMKGTQVGGTEAGNNWLGYIIHHAPGPTMMVLPTSNTAKRSSKTRLAPMIEETPALSDRVKESRSRDSGNTTMMKEFKGGVLIIAGANSSAELRSAPVKYLFCDEVDAYPEDVDEEGDPVSLAEKRTDTFARAKRLKVSTPTIKGRSRIERSYKASDQRRYFVPCPHCNGEQWLKWERLRWETRKSREIPCEECGTINALEVHDQIIECVGCQIAINVTEERLTIRDTGELIDVHYECEHCLQPIAEHYKTQMLHLGRWIAQAPGKGKAAGFHLSALYSPLGWFSWGKAITQYLDALKDLTGVLMKVWTNTVEGETYNEKGEQPSDLEIKERAEPYKLRTVPIGGLLLTAGVDVQADRLEVKVKAWGRGEESWLVTHEVIHGDTSQTDAWDSLDDFLMNSSFLHASGAPLRITATAVDSGYRTHEVYQFCRLRKHRHVFPVKGQSRAGKSILGRPTDQDVNHKGKTIKAGIKLWPVGSDTAKDLVYGRLKIMLAGPGCMHFPIGLPDEYYQQLTSEKKVTSYIRGYSRTSWEKDAGARNEALDLEVYAYAAALYAGVTRINWDKLEASINPGQQDLFVKAAQAAPNIGPSEIESKEATESASEVVPDSTQAIAKQPPQKWQPKRAGGFINSWKG